MGASLPTGRGAGMAAKPVKKTGPKASGPWALALALADLDVHDRSVALAVMGAPSPFSECTFKRPAGVASLSHRAGSMGSWLKAARDGERRGCAVIDRVA